MKVGKTAKRLPTYAYFLLISTRTEGIEQNRCTFMENVWLLEPALVASKNMTICRKKASQMREFILFAILRMQEYTRTPGRSLATDNHKYANETMNNCKINEVHPPP